MPAKTQAFWPVPGATPAFLRANGPVPGPGSRRASSRGKTRWIWAGGAESLAHAGRIGPRPAREGSAEGGGGRENRGFSSGGGLGAVAKLSFWVRKGGFLGALRIPDPHPPPERGPKGGWELVRKNTWFLWPLPSAAVKKLYFLAAKHPRKPVRFAMAERGASWRVKTRHFRAGWAAAARENAGFGRKPSEKTLLLRPGAQNRHLRTTHFRTAGQILRVFSFEVRPGALPLLPILQRGAARLRAWGVRV